MTLGDIGLLVRGVRIPIRLSGPDCSHKDAAEYLSWLLAGTCRSGGSAYVGVSDAVDSRWTTVILEWSARSGV